MNSPKVNKTNSSNSPKVRNLSAIIAVMLVAVTLFQAGNLKSNDLSNKEVSTMEAELIADIDQFFADEDFILEEEIYMEMEEEAEEVNIFDADNNIFASGNPANDIELRKLVNQADYISSFGSEKYYRLSK